MAFTKSFPKRSEKSVYPEWQDVSLSPEEERAVEEKARAENNKLMSQCLDDAKHLLEEKQLKGYETSLAAIATALFDKRASHVAYWKEEKARDKFEKD